MVPLYSSVIIIPICNSYEENLGKGILIRHPYAAESNHNHNKSWLFSWLTTYVLHNDNLPTFITGNTDEAQKA